MSTVSIRDLQRKTSGIVLDVARSRRPTLVTCDGEPVAVLVPVDPHGIADALLAEMPDLADELAAAEADYAAGDARPASAVFEEIEAEDR